MESPKHTNRLIEESSPYLLQHAHNPVDWQPWSDDAFAQARGENKLVIISVGYAACHWCHVMEHESFEDDEVAALMNDHFVSIKVDREERPDIDQVYIEAVQIMTGSGGWPLNCIVLPDGRPIYGGTYFRKTEWIHLLKSLHNTYQNEPQRIEEYAQKLMKGLEQYNAVPENSSQKDFVKQDLITIVDQWKRQFDSKHGGDGGAPKFPMPNSLQFLMEYAQLFDDADVLNHLNLTLTKMAAGGIYDQIGGGFARYSVDAMWKVPHFEKMLYDNGQLLSLYAKAYELTKNPRYKEVVYQTVAFVERELMGADDNFFCSLDADSEGVEGKFYVWDADEIDKLLGADAQIIKEYYAVDGAGQWEGSNILLMTSTFEEFCAAKQLDALAFRKRLDEASEVLFQARSVRVRPGLDDKTLTSWNALMLVGLLDAYQTFNEEAFLKLALRNASFLKTTMIADDYRVSRSYKNGKLTINGFLDDYAFLIEAFFGLYNASFDESWLMDAHALIEYTISHFYDEQSGTFYYTSDLDPALVTRKRELSDNVISSSNSAMARNLYTASLYFGNMNYKDMAVTMLSAVSEALNSGGKYYSNWLSLMIRLTGKSKEVVVVGEDAVNLIHELKPLIDPLVLLSGSTCESDLSLFKSCYVKGETLIYLCENNVCKQPVKDLDLVREWLS